MVPLSAEVCLSSLKRSRTIAEALDLIAEETGRQISQDALRGRLKRAGYGGQLEKYLALDPWWAMGKPSSRGDEWNLADTSIKDNCPEIPITWDEPEKPFVFKQGEYPANPAPDSMGIWPLKGWEPAGDSIPVPAPPRSPYRYQPPASGLQTWIVWPDMHVPFHDRQAVDLVLRVAKDLKPYGQVLIGDFPDMMSTSRHPKTPQQLRWQLKDEVEAVNEMADRLDSLGCKETHYCLGNHCIFGQRKAMTDSIGLYDSLDPRHLFHTDQRGWYVHDYQVPVKLGKIWFQHDTDYVGPSAAKQNGDMFQSSTVQGHVHSAQVIYSGSALGERHVSATVGWLGDPQYAKYMASIKKTRNWQQAFGLMRIEPNGNTHFQLVPIIDRHCIVDGELYT